MTAGTLCSVIRSDVIFTAERAPEMPLIVRPLGLCPQCATIVVDLAEQDCPHCNTALVHRVPRRAGR